MNPTVEFQLELQVLRDQLGDAILHSRLSDIDEGFRTYRRLVETVLDHFRALELLGETPPGAMFNVYGSEMQWIEDAIDTFIEQGARTTDPEVLRRVLGFIIDLGHLSFEKRERSAFAAALDRLVWLWRASSEYLSGRQWDTFRRHLLVTLQNLLDHYVGRELAAASQDELANRLSFLAKGFSTFSDILRLSVDRNEFEDFKDASQHFNDALEFSFGKLHDVVTSESETRDVKDIRVRLLALPDAVALGIHAWILLRTRSAIMASEDAVRFIDAFLDGHLSRLPLWRGYQLARESDLESLLHWHFWEMELRGNRAGFITFGGYLDEAYVRHLLQRDIEGLPGHGLMTHAEIIESRYTFDRLSQVAMETAAADPPLDESAASQVNEVVQKMQELEEEAKRLEDDELIGQALDAERIERFKGALRASWSASGRLRKLCDGEGAQPLPMQDDVLPLGVNRLVPKYYFVDSRVHADPINLGEDFAQAMVRGETSLILGPLVAGVQELTCSYDDFLNKLRLQVQSLRRAGYSPIVLISNSWRMLGALRDYLTPYPQPGMELANAPQFEGAPVLYEYLDERDLCIVADLPRLIRLSFFEPTMVRTNDALYEGNRLLIGVEAIDETRARELVEGDEGFLRRGEQTLTIDDAIRELMKDVNVRIFEKLKAERADAEAGAVIRLEEDARMGH